MESALFLAMKVVAKRSFLLDFSARLLEDFFVHPLRRLKTFKCSHLNLEIQ